MKFALVLFSIVVILQSVGQIFERKGMMQIGQLNNTHMILNADNIIKIITNPYVIAGVLLSAVGLILWLVVLSNVNVSYIFPFGAVAYILLAVLATTLLGEEISMTRWFGIAVIVAGVIMIQR